MCQLICAILFLLLNNFIINLNFLSCSCVYVCVLFLTIQFPSYLRGCALTAAHTTHSHGHNRLFCSPKKFMFAQKPGMNNVRAFCDLINKHKCSSQLEARCHRGNNLFPLQCMEIKITLRLALNSLAQKVVFSFSGD